METNRFFKWTARINSMLFLVLLLLSIVLVTYAISESNKWKQRTAVNLIDEKNDSNDDKNLNLGSITKVCGTNFQYIKLTSSKESESFSSGGYGNTTRNVVFFAGKDMDSHWLFDTNGYLISEIDQLKKSADDCKKRETVAIYFEIRKEDSDNNGKLDEKDELTVALTSPDGKNYTEIEIGLTSVLDHSVNDNASVLTLLVQSDSTLIMKKYSLLSKKKISEKEITKIGKKL